MKRILLILVLLGLAGAIAYYRGWLQKEQKQEGLFLSGNVEVTESNMGFKITGRIVELAVDEGQHVKAGERLAALDGAELESVVAQNRASLQEAKVKLEELLAGSRPQEIEEAKSNVQSIEAELTKAEKDFNRTDILFKKGVAPATQFDSAQSAYRKITAQHKSALQRLSLITEGPRKEQIKAAEFRVEQAKSALRVSEERLRDTILYAPYTGVILRKNAELGETLAQGIPVYTLGDLESPWIKVYVKEDKLGLVKLGQQARISVDTYPGKAYEGTVTFISSEAEFTPKNVQTKEERVKLVFGVKVSAKNVNQELKPGMPADVRILVNE